MPHLASLLLWLMGFCLISPSAAACLQIKANVGGMQYKGDTISDNCIDFTTTFGASVGKMGFFESSLDTINVPYASSYGLAFGKMSFKDYDASNTVNLECSSGCGSGSAGSGTSRKCNGGSGTSTSYSGCGCTVRVISFGMMAFKNDPIYQSCCSGNTG